MSQIAQLSETEIEDRFHIVGTRPVAFLLAGFAREVSAFRCSSRRRLSHHLLAASPEKGRLIIDCSGSPISTAGSWPASAASSFAVRAASTFSFDRAGAEMLFSGAQPSPWPCRSTWCACNAGILPDRDAAAHPLQFIAACRAAPC